MVSTRRSKRQRLMVSSYVSPRRPDLPAIFESLNDDTLTTVLEFVGRRSYKSFGGINKQCREIYLTTEGMTKETFVYGYAPLSVIIDRIERRGRYNLEGHGRVGKGVVYHNRSDVLDWVLQERNNYFLRGICAIAAMEGRIDILNEVYNNMNDEDDKRNIFYHVVEYAALCGKLNVLKWLETKGLFNNKKYCAAQAAEGGHLHILKWLREEKGLELFGGLYSEAIKGGRLHVMKLHVMKWLKEKACPWGEYAFPYAAEEGNLNILQWLHDEGCPWPRVDEYRVGEGDLKAEVVDWCRANGYGNRIVSEED